MKLLLHAFIGLFSLSLVAQQTLPKGLTEDEKSIMRDYYSSYTIGGRGITTPPTGDIRCAAEWEEVQTLVITWTGQFDGIHSQITDAAQEECRVLILSLIHI